MASHPKRTIEADHFSADTLEFMRLLESHNVQYVIVGGEAVIFHGYPRFTGDVDFFYSSGDENTQRLFEALLAFWDNRIPAVRSVHDLRSPGAVIQFGRPPNRIDLLTAIDGVPFELAWETRINVSVAGADYKIETAFLSLVALLQNKRASGRPKDLDDIEHLEKVRR